jgi:hypothetical protein
VKRIAIIAAVVAALALASTAAAALVPGVFDPGNTGCVKSTFSHGVLHLEKNCPTSTNAAAGADITGLTGQPFVSASFTLASASQCQGGSPRFNVFTNDATHSQPFFLGCNNVTPTTNADGTVTYTFNAATIAAGGNQVPFPTGTITSVEVLIDVQGTADLSNITVNGIREVPTPGAGKHHKLKHPCPHNRTRDHDCGLHKGHR